MTISITGGERICFVLLTGVGDAVHGLAVVNAIKDQVPFCHLTWVAEPPAADLVSPHPSVDRTVVFRKSAGARGVAELWRRMRPLEFELTINTQRYLKSAFPTLFSRAPLRLGLDRGRARDGVWLFSNRRLPRRPWRHVQDVMLEFLGPLGIPTRPPRWGLAPTAEERADQEAFFGPLRGRGRPLVSLVTASGNARKDWPADRQAELTRLLERELGARVLLVGGPGDRDRAAAERVRAEPDLHPVLALSRTVRRVLWLLDGSDLVVSPDTGPLHIAHALGVPVVGLFGHTNPWRVGPYQRFRDLVVDRYTDPGEAPDPSRTESRPGRMERIGVEDVWEKVRLALDRYPRRTGSEEPGRGEWPGFLDENGEASG